MTEMITLSRVDRVPPDERIHHYDELPEKAKNHLPRLVETAESNVAASEQVADAFESYDLVKFTEYYRIAVREEPSSSSGSR